VWRPGDGTWYWGTSASGFNDAAARAKQWGNDALGGRRHSDGALNAPAAGGRSGCWQGFLTGSAQ